MVVLMTHFAKMVVCDLPSIDFEVVRSSLLELFFLQLDLHVACPHYPAHGSVRLARAHHHHPCPSGDGAQEL